MNTKGIKFLAVLAVLAMAFAAVAVITPVQGNDAAVLTEDVYADCIKAGNENVSEINSDTITKYYFSEDASVKVKKLAADVTIYVNNGVNVELKFGQNAADVGGKTLTLVTVSGDRAGKLVYNNDNEIAKTQITFTTEEKTTFEYTAAKIKADGSKDANATFSYNGVLALGAPAGAQLDIAPGEEIKIKEDAINETNDTFGYGIAYTAVEKVENVDTDFVYFTAPGATKSGYNLDETKAKMWIKSGSGSVYYLSDDAVEGTLGTVTATFTGVKTGTNDPVVTDRSAGINVSNATEGTVTFTGKGNLALTGTIAEKATVEIGKDILIMDGTLTNEGKLILNNAGNEDFVITNHGTVIAKNSNLWLKDTQSGDYTGIKGIDTTNSTGLVDTSAISYILPTQPGEVGNLTVGVGQILTLTGNLTVANKLIVDGGTLNINSGVTVTIKEGAIFQVGGNSSIYTQVNNNGTISIKAGDVDTVDNGVLTIAEKSTFDNNGTIKAESKAPAKEGDVTKEKITAIKNASENFVNNGKITISKNDTFVLGDFDDDKAFINNGTIEFSGVVAGEIANDGTVTFMNGSKITGEVIIKMKSKDAKVDVKGVEIQTGESLTISSTTTKKDGSIVITADDGVDVATIKNVLVANTAGLDVSGSVSTNAKVTAKLSGLVNVTGTLTIPKDMTLSLASAADVEVSGTLTLAADSDVNVDALDYKVNVTGKIVDNTGKVDPTMGVVYTGTNNQVITDFVTALSEAQEAKINSVEVYGTNTVEGDIIIPAGMAVSGSEDGKLKLKSGSITVIVGETESASLAVDVIIVKGELFSADAGTISGVVTADVAIETESDDRTAVAYMDLKTALSTTVSTIALMDNADVTVSEDLTIPAGMTLDARNGKLLVEGCTLTVDGRLMVDSEYAAGGFGVKDSHVALGAMTVNGYYMMLNTEIGKDTFWYPAGVLYQTDIEEEEGTSKFFVITSIDNLSTAVLENTGDIVDITGNTKIGDVTIAGTESNPVTVRFNGPIDAGTIILSDATIDTNKQDIVKATFASLYGSITIRNASTSKLLITEDDGLSASGTIADIEYEEDKAKTAYYLGFDGIVEVGGFTADTPVEHDDESDATIDMDGILTASGKTVTFNHDIIVTGSLIADNSTKINVNGDVQLLGNLIAMEKTEEGLSAGSIDIIGDVYAGALKDTLFVKPSAATGDGATMSGRISIEGVSYVLASTTVDYEIVEDFNSLDISVDDEPYITVYTSGTTVTFPEVDGDTYGLVLPIESAKISGIEDINGDSVVDKDKLYFDAKNNTITAVGFSITDVDWINVTINENVYSVIIKTDNGVKSVELGNMVMTQGTNEFTLTGLEAGTYTVTYSLKAGYEGTPVITTSMGTIIQGYTISVSGDYSEPIVYQLTGTQKEVEPEPVTPEEKSEWTITTILLVILVILIAVMAVIVAMRLNRS